MVDSTSTYQGSYASATDTDTNSTDKSTATPNGEAVDNSNDSTATTASDTDSQTTTASNTDTAVNTSTTTQTTKTALPIYIKNITIETDIGVALTVPPVSTNITGSAKWSVDDLPSGLSINADTGTITGAITGTPLQDIIEISCEDSTGNKGSAEYTFIANPALGAKGDNNVTRYVGYSLNTTVTGTGGTGTYTYHIDNCPTGVAINAHNGTISGTLPSVGAKTLNVIVNDGITSVNYPVTFNMANYPTATPSTTPENFYRRRMSALGIAKLNEAIKLRMQPIPNYDKAGQDFLTATRLLRQDDTDEIIQAFADMHKKYANDFLREEVFFLGMMNGFSVYDIKFVNVVYHAFRQVIHYHRIDTTDWNEFLTYTCSQRTRWFLEDYYNKYVTYGIG